MGWTDERGDASAWAACGSPVSGPRVLCVEAVLDRKGVSAGSGRRGGRACPCSGARRSNTRHYRATPQDALMLLTGAGSGSGAPTTCFLCDPGDVAVSGQGRQGPKQMSL